MIRTHTDKAMVTLSREELCWLLFGLGYARESAISIADRLLVEGLHKRLQFAHEALPAPVVRL